MEKAVKLIKDLNIKHNDYVVLACSYGPDSMVLLDILIKLNLNIIIAHVNHKLRKESDEEEILLNEFCLKNNLQFEKLIIEEYPDGNFEMNARNIRYDFFEKTIKKYQAKYLFTAHHGDDLVETILMRITRGSTFKGYAGFDEVTNNNDYQIIRPLIHYSKEDVLKYASDNNIMFAIDYTNYEDKYTRNRYRNNVIPFLKNENKNVHQKFLAFSKEIHLYEDYFNRKTNNYYNELFKNDRININEFNLIDDLFKKRVLEKILLTTYKKDIYKITDKHLNLIMDLIASDKTNSYVVLPNNYRVTKFYNILEFKYHEKLDVAYNYHFKNSLELELGTIKRLEQDIDDNSNNIIRLSSSEIKLPLRVRTRKNGDKIAVKNLNGHKKISDIFIESKLSSNDREKYPIVVDNNGEILWIPSIKKSQLDKQKSETYDIILKYEKKGDIYEGKKI